MNKHNSDRCSGKRSRVFLDSAAAIFSLARGTELTAGSGALWSGLLLFYWFIIACYISVKCLTNTMFIFTQKLLNRDVLQRILHCWASEWRDSDDSRLWRHKLYLVTTQIQRGRLYDSATWPPSLDQPSSDHLQRGQPFCQRHCLFVNLCCCCYCCCCNPIICADLRGTATAPLIPASLPSATPKTHSASWPRPQRSTGSDGRSLVGYRPKETQHCCRVTSVVFTDACSDSTNAGHHLLCAQYWRQCWVSCGVRMVERWPQPLRADFHYVPPPVTLKALIRTASGKEGGRNTETEATTIQRWHEGLQYVNWCFTPNQPVRFYHGEKAMATETESVFFFFFFGMHWSTRMITDDTMEVHFETTWQCHRPPSLS